MTTLKEALALLGEPAAKVRKNIASIANELLGKYKEVIPSGKSSTSFIKRQRFSLYGKVK